MRIKKNILDNKDFLNHIENEINSQLLKKQKYSVTRGMSLKEKPFNVSYKYNGDYGSGVYISGFDSTFYYLDKHYSHLSNAEKIKGSLVREINFDFSVGYFFRDIEEFIKCKPGDIRLTGSHMHEGYCNLRVHRKDIKVGTRFYNISNGEIDVTLLNGEINLGLKDYKKPLTRGLFRSISEEKPKQFEIKNKISKPMFFIKDQKDTKKNPNNDLKKKIFKM